MGQHHSNCRGVRGEFIHFYHGVAFGAVDAAQRSSRALGASILSIAGGGVHFPGGGWCCLGKDGFWHRVAVAVSSDSDRRCDSADSLAIFAPTAGGSTPYQASNSSQKRPL